jgi:CopG family nickel-responsive transcriptional regulator
MKRLTMSLDDDLADAFEALVQGRGYENRSEAFRDLLRQDLGNARLRDEPDAPCVATLSYVYNHHQRQLALRLTDLQHDHHELTVATTHAHLDHDHCIETVILRGRSDAVRAFALSVIAQPGVSHGSLHVVPMAARHAHGHEHLEPATARAAPGRAPALRRIKGGAESPRRRR